MHPETNIMDESWLAPAKLNLFLHITGRRPDGYHNLQTLFQLLDWGDELRFSISNSGDISRWCSIDGIPETEDICVRAAHLLKNRLGIQKGVHIELTKRIPMGAGLGGGSSDAATVLLALNQLWSCGLSIQQLADMGLELGADVPVFVHGHSALAEGRGEKIKAVELEQVYYVLVFPGFSISTAEVFNHPSLRRDSSLIDLSQTPLQAGRNDCEPAVFEMYPELKNIMFDLRTTGHAHMSGTGSTVFLHFDNKKAAIRAAHNLECRYNVRVVGGVNRSHGLQSKSV